MTTAFVAGSAETAPVLSVDRVFLALVGTLLGLGVLMVYSSSVTSRPTEFERIYLERQLAAATLGLMLAVGASQLSSRAWQRWLPWLFAGVCILLICVLIPGLGTSVKGARRWLRIGGVSLQPSELAKLVLPLWTCWLITRETDRKTGRGLWRVAWPTALLVPLVFLEPDLGTSVFLLLGTAISLYLSGWPMWWFGASLGALLPAGFGIWLLKPYQWQRIVGFIETWRDLDGAPYQIRQSLVTLGAGGWSGTGLGKGWQKLSFLPEANTDFVFAVIGEELGLSGTLGLVAIWCGIYLCGVRLLSRQRPDSFEFLAGMTLLSQLVVQAMMNVAVVTAMLPPKGIAHPLVSAGGSNLVVSLTILGTIWGLAHHRPTIPCATPASSRPSTTPAAPSLPANSEWTEPDPAPASAEIPMPEPFSAVESSNPSVSGNF